MAMRSHVMTARRKAALRKAQLASARKRRKGNISAEKARRKRLRGKGRYAGPGALHRSRQDYGNSKGYFSRTRTGKPIGKVRKKARKVQSVVMLAHPTNAAIYGTSYLRHRRAQKKKR